MSYPSKFPSLPRRQAENALKITVFYFPLVKFGVYKTITTNNLLQLGNIKVCVAAAKSGEEADRDKSGSLSIFEQQ
jgi:hypothetical protein